jgi:RNA polymerase sigma-70 factor (ECF subfamily)
MDDQNLHQRLSQISTQWTMLIQAHQGTKEAVLAAQTEFVERYREPIYRYLLGAVRDPDVAEDLAQEFMHRFVRGDFRRASPKQGRFRNYLKTSLRNLVTDHRRRQQAQAQSLVARPAEPAIMPDDVTVAEHAFWQSCRESLWARSWEALEQVEQKTGQPCHTVLRLNTDQPKLSSAELAEKLGKKVGKTFSVHGYRQALHRAREKFADLLLREVERSLPNPTLEEVEQELIDLGWLSCCQAALERRRRR